MGTGTGIFLERLASSYPTAVLDGYDISAEQYPDKATLPSNVNLKILDIKQPIPDELMGVYDVVHLRLLLVAMSPSDWDPVGRNVSKLLKPGGALQWEENDFLNSKYVRGPVGSTVSTMDYIIRTFQEVMREHFSHGWNELPDLMTDADLIHVEKDVVSSDRLVETRKDVSANVVAVIMLWARMMVSKNVPGSWSAKRLVELENNAYKDVESGSYVRYEIYVTLGFKPLE